MQLRVFFAPGQLLPPPFAFIHNRYDYIITNTLMGFALAIAVWNSSWLPFPPMQIVMLHVDAADNVAQVKS